MTKESDTEVDALVAVLGAPTGVLLSLFMILTVGRLEDGSYAVWQWRDDYTIEHEDLFAEPRPAVLRFLELRHALKLGLDYLPDGTHA